MSRILVVDDEAAVGRSIGRLLRLNGFEVEYAERAAAALELLAFQTFAVIISDEKMPGCGGVELLETCAREYPDTVRILLTGYADPQTAAEAVNRAEIFRLLWKPWSDEELVAIIRQAAWRYALATDSAPLVPLRLLAGGII